MKLHYETVSPLLVEVLQQFMKSSIFDDFFLVEGTCLSLQFGHRRSIDIDLFTSIPYGTMNTTDIKRFMERNFPYIERIDTFEEPSLGYSVFVGKSPMDKVKVDLFYTEPNIFPLNIVDGIRLADVRDIAAMKLEAISQDIPRQKDFWDIHELNETFSIRDMIEWASQRNQCAVTEQGLIKGFENIDNVPESIEGIDCLKGNYWSLVKDDLKEAMQEYLQNK